MNTHDITQTAIFRQDCAHPRAETLCWFALQTRPRFEKKVAAELREKRIEAFLPVQNSLRRWSDRRQLVEMPLFPGYVFVRAASTVEARVSVLRTIGVTSFVGVRGIGTMIPDEEVSAIQTLLMEKVAFQPHPYLTIGQKIRIRGGSLDGIQGILTQIRGDQSLVVSVELIQRSIAMRVSGFQVEAI
jgi:transcription antitermination factor NusG